MKPVDIRNEGWESIQDRLEGDRAAVYEALLAGGPATTRGLAARMNADPFSVRPRVTELFQCGLAALAGRAGREGVYAAVPIEIARETFEAAKERAGHEVQQLLPI